jgi:hypothetical protein
MNVMPGFDQTGPTGQGSMTGRRMGRCTNYGRSARTEESRQENLPPDDDVRYGNGQGRGRFARGRRGGMGRGSGRAR